MITSLLMTLLLASCHSKIRTKLKESQIYTIKLPAQPYKYREGEGFISEPDDVRQSLTGRNDLVSVLQSFKSSQDIINIPTKFLSNGKPSIVKYDESREQTSTSRADAVETSESAETTSSTTDSITTSAALETTTVEQTTTAPATTTTATTATTVKPTILFPSPLFLPHHHHHPTTSSFQHNLMRPWTTFLQFPTPIPAVSNKNYLLPASTSLIRPALLYPRIQYHLPLIFNPYQHFFRGVNNYFHG